MTLDDIEALEQARCAAMLAADVQALGRMFDDDLRWAHASGKVDTKVQMLTQFGDGSMRVFALDRLDTQARLFGTAAVVTGVVRMEAAVGGVRREVNSRYAGVWSWHDRTPRLVNWQSARVG